MKRNLLAAVVGIGLLLVVAFGAYFMKSPGDKSNPSEINADLLKVIDVDEMVRHPDQFEGSIGVAGKVVKVDESKTSFALGCEDACVMMPVRYNGRMPDLESEIVVYGQIKQAEGGKYIFEGQNVEVR